MNPENEVYKTFIREFQKGDFRIRECKLCQGEKPFTVFRRKAGNKVAGWVAGTQAKHEMIKHVKLEHPSFYESIVRKHKE